MATRAAPTRPRALFASTARDTRSRARLTVLVVAVGALALAVIAMLLALGWGPAGPWPPG